VEEVGWVSDVIVCRRGNWEGRRFDALEEELESHYILAAGGDFHEGAVEGGEGAKGTGERGERGGERCAKVVLERRYDEVRDKGSLVL